MIVEFELSSRLAHESPFGAACEPKQRECVIVAQDESKARRIVIAGGGISGLSIAVRLSQSGLPVTLFEAGLLGRAASTKNQGWLHSGAWFAPKQRDLARCCHESLQQTTNFCPECVEPGTAPMLYLLSSRSTPPSHWTEAWSASGIPYEEMPVDAVMEETGIANSIVHQAYRLPDRAIRTNVLLERLTAQAEYQGADLRTMSLVTALIKNGDRVEGVITSRGEEIRARLVILAANVGGADLWPRGSRNGLQSEFTRVALKTHCLTVSSGLARTPFCIVDRDGLSHIPHPPASIFGSSRWIAVTDIADRSAVANEIAQLKAMVVDLYPQIRLEDHGLVGWAGTTVQAMHFNQIEPGLAPLPTVIDHEREPPCVSNLLSVFPGRASLWSQLAEATRRIVLEKLGERTNPTSKAPWALASPSQT